MAVAAALLRQLPGGSALDEPILQWLASALADLAAEPSANASEAASALAGFLEHPPSASVCEELLERIQRGEAPAEESGWPELGAELGGAPSESAPAETATEPATAAAGEVDEVDESAWWPVDAAAAEGVEEGAWWSAAELEADPGFGWDEAGAEAQWREQAQWGEATQAASAAADAAVSALHARFPHLDHATVCTVLLSVGGDSLVRPPATACSARRLTSRAGCRGGAGGGERRAAAAAAAAGRCGVISHAWRRRTMCSWADGIS
jgi:hypothetical protein